MGIVIGEPEYHAERREEDYFRYFLQTEGTPETIHITSGRLL
jgi:hypothetical protein